MRGWLIAALLTVAACGGSPSAPTPTPTPTPAPTFTGTVTDTVSGASVAGYTATIAGSRVTIAAPGYEPRETDVARATVDLIPTAPPFDLTFYRQFARNALDGGSPDVLRVLSVAPSVYLDRDGLDDATIAEMEAAIRAAMPAFTGDRFQLGTWDAGSGTRSPQAGWLMIDTAHQGGNGICGRTDIGAAAGHTVLNLDTPNCHWPIVIAHELGHALGFGHVSRTDCLMNLGATRQLSVTQPCDAERYMGAIAYHRTAGNRDIDIDP